MPTYRVVWRLFTYSPVSFTAALLCSVAVFGLPVPLGLVTRAFFDALTQHAPAGSIGGVIALFVVVEVAGICANAGLSYAWGSFLHTSMALLRRNLLRDMLRAHAATALREPAGSIVTRFRDDVEEVVESVDAWLDLAGRSITVAVALAIMLRISVAITVAAFVPLIVVVVVVNQAKHPIAEYRLRSREALGRASGFLGDLLGAVQAVKVAGATSHVVSHLRDAQ